MKRLVALLLLIAIAYGGWYFYQQSNSVTRLSSPTGEKITLNSLTLQDNPSTLSNLESVLGDSISAGIGLVTDIANQVTDGDAEPIINKAISNFQTELKQLPEDQVKKIQYNYCKGIVNEYEKME